MKYNVKVVAPEVLIPPLITLLDEAESVPLLISGSSMTPFLVHGRDTVYLSKPKRPLRRGDMVLYQRRNGAYVLHRIHRVCNGSYTMVGDAQTQLEPGICQEQVLALVTAVKRKGTLLEPTSFRWRFFEKIWIRMVPLRPAAMALYSRLKKSINLWSK